MPQDQGGNLGNTKDQPNVEEASKHDWFKKLKRPLTPDPDWNTRKSIDFRPPQIWISRIAQAEKPPLTFDELMSTLIDFSKYVMHNLKIDNLTQQHLVGPTFNMLKGTCKSRVELEYHFKEFRRITAVIQGLLVEIIICLDRDGYLLVSMSELRGKGLVSLCRRKCVVMIPFLVAPRVSALTGCDRLVSEPMVIENIFAMFSPTSKKSRWGTVFPPRLKSYMEPLVEPKEI
ncbi:hypothetical protein Tco_0155900 [Tanacetum coccineum]